MVTELLNKYIWLVNTFVRAGERGLSLDEICRRWESRFGSSYSRRTFNNHRMNVEEIFGIRIDCNRSTNRYFIDCSDDVSDEEINRWMDIFETFRIATGSAAKPKSRNAVIKWLNDPHSDSAEYKMWGNGVALPCVFFVLSGIAYYAQSESP